MRGLAKKPSKRSAELPPRKAPQTKDVPETDFVNIPKSMWVIMKAFNWTSVVVLGDMPLAPSPGEPQRFIPVFDSREEAVKWNGGSEENVVEVRTL